MGVGIDIGKVFGVGVGIDNGYDIGSGIGYGNGRGSGYICADGYGFSQGNGDGELFELSADSKCGFKIW